MKINKFYNTSALTEISKRGYYKEKINFFIVNLIKNQKNKSGINILDVACNDGELTEIYSKYGHVIGIDLNKHSIELCKKRNIECLCCDFQNISDSYNNYFDIVIAGDIIEHIFDTDLFLEKIFKLLNKQGKLLLTTPNLASFGRRIMLFLGRNPFIEFSTRLPSKKFNVGHIRYYTKANLEKQLKHRGFMNIKFYGDRINLSNKIYLPHGIVRYFPSLSRNLMLYAEKK